MNTLLYKIALYKLIEQFIMEDEDPDAALQFILANVRLG